MLDSAPLRPQEPRRRTLRPRLFSCLSPAIGSREPVLSGNKERYQLGGIRSDIAQRRQKLARANQLFRESNQTPSIEILVASAEDTEDDIEDQMDMSFNSPRSSTPVYQHEPTFDIDTLTPAAAAVPQIPQTDGGSKARDATDASPPASPGFNLASVSSPAS